MTIHVLHINAGNLYGGVETIVVTLARERAVCPEMVPHFAVCFAGRFSEALTEAGSPPFKLGGVRLRYPWQILRARQRLRSLLRQHHFDVVICHMSWTLLIFGPAVRAAGVPLALWMHNQMQAASWPEKLAGLTMPDLVLCVGQATLRDAQRLFEHSRHALFYTPFAFSPPLTSTRDNVRTSLGIAKSTVVLIQVSRLEPWKGHLELFESLALIQHCRSWVLWIVGGAQRAKEEQYLRTLRAAAQRLGISSRVHFLGERRDVGALLAAADIYCQSNTGAEGFSISFLEALSAGLPVVTTALGGAKDIIDESCGVLVPTGERQSFANAVERIAESAEERRELGMAGRVKVRSMCDPRQQLPVLHRLLSGLK
jgi:glycosyltransferase involved in cell wall biosynthesis